MPEETLSSSAGIKPSGLALERGESIGRYVVLDRLGAGGMGVVFAAYDPELDRKVALKLLHAEGVAEASEGQRRLLREAQAMARLSHPNVVTVHDVGTHVGRVFVAMEFVAGKTLRQWIATRRPWREVIEAFAAAGRGLTAAHGAALVHRDFKPDNVMIGDDTRVRVMDFGLARSGAIEGEPASAPSGDPLAALTQPGGMLGTPAYMAPEQYTGATADARSDQFSFCVSLWECLYGARPFSGTSAAELAVAIIEEEPKALPTGDRGVPPWIRRVLLRGLAKDPNDRWPSIAALTQALQHDPRRRYMFAAATAGGLVVVAAYPAAQYLERGRVEAECDERAHEIDAAWNDDARRDIEAAFLATSVPIAAETWTKLEPRLDTIASAWSSARRDACIAVEGEHESDAIDCLAERSVAFETVLETFAEAEPDLVLSAVLTASEIAASSDCLTDAPRRELPNEPNERAQALALQHTLAAADTLTNLGRLEAAQALLDPIDADALPWGAAPLALSRGRLAVRQGRAEPAVAALQDAYFGAGADAQDELATRAAIELVEAEGQLRARPDAARTWAETAHMLLRRTGREQEPVMADLLDREAALLFRGGDPIGAEQQIREAIAIFEASLGPDHPQTAIVRASLAQALHMQGRLDDALVEYDRARVVLEDAVGPEHPDVIGLTMSIGQVYFDQAAFDDAMAAFTRADAAAARVLGPRHPQRAYVRNAMGNVLFTRQDLDAAEAAYRDTFEILVESRGPDHPDVAGAHASLAMIDEARGEFASALKRHERALAIRLATVGPEHPDVASTHHQVGVVKAAMGDYAAAEESFVLSAKVAENAMGPDHPQLALPLTGLGRARLARGASAEAIEPLERALAIHEHGGLDTPMFAETANVLGQALWASDGDRSRARALVTRAGTAYGSAGPGYAAVRAEAQAWLDAHPL